MMKYLHIFFYICWCILMIFGLLFTINIVSYITSQPPTWPNRTQGILTSIGNLYLPAFGMYLHFLSGFFLMIFSNFQLLPIFEYKYYRLLHKVFGTINVFFCLTLSLGGLTFISSNGTSGGLNMSLAFSCYGVLLLIMSIVTYVYIRYRNKQKHIEWAIRLYALIMSSLFYRILYLIAFVCGYRISSAQDFKRPLDMCFDWMFFIMPLCLAELIVQYNRRYRAVLN